MPAVSYFKPDSFDDGHPASSKLDILVVPPYSRGGKIAHSYSDHASVLKFIERNWHLDPLTTRSRDNLPNPIATPGNPYVPVNMPAVGDLFDMFDFQQGDQGQQGQDQ